MSDAVLRATIKAYDEFTQQFQKFQSELKKTDQAQKQMAQGTEQANRSVSSFFQTIGQVGALYAFQRGLRDVMSTGREFELTIKQAQAVTGDFSRTLRDLAMAGRGGSMDVFRPTELAQAYRELGAAGADTNDIMAATPDVLEFATAALIDMDKSAAAILSTAKAFNIAFTDTGQIVDAYTEAMNRGALTGQDFQWIMGSVGAVAKMAGQDFREILSVGSAMRDSGIQAQDAGTSIKAALLQLINPTKEAQDVMKDLGINIYDASGRMKQWSEITAEFEKALTPLNEQSRNLVLTTVLGSDGIRAMATSINKGSGYLREFTDGLKNSEGATNKMASAMADTFDGAIKRTNASLERAKILLFEDFADASIGFLETINRLLVGFNNVDEGTRKLIELFAGSVGLVAALGLVASTIRIAVIPALRTLGITTSAALGPVVLLIGGITTLAGVLITSKVAAEGARVETERNNKEIIAAGDNYLRLNEKLNTVNENTDEYKTLQGQANSALQELARKMPEVISQWDAEGNAIAVNNDLLREKIRLTKEAAQETARTTLADSQKEYEKYYNTVTELSQRLNDLQSGKASPKRTSYDYHLSEDYLRAEEIKSTTEELNKAIEKRDKALASVRKSSAALGLTHTNWSDYSKDPSKFLDQITSEAQGESKAGNKVYTPKSSGSTKNPAAEAARKYIEAVTAALYPYKAAADAASDAVAGLGAKEQYLAQVMQSGQGTAYQAVELNKVRTEQLVALSDLQTKLHRQAEAEREALAGLQEQYANATDPNAARELRDEIDNLTRSVARLGQEWWQAEQQKLSLAEQVRREEKKRYDDAYQQAMDLMRHQVTMARMSSEQQIEYLERLRDAHEWTQQQMWSIEEDLYRLRRQQLSDYLSRLDDEYKSKLDAIEARTKKATDSIQAQIDALDGEGKAASREEALRKHNKKLAELQEKRRYHELRTGREHAKAIADIDKEITEEQRQFELQQQEWTREDKKDDLQKQLDDARKAGDEERKQLEDHYRKARKIAEGGMLDIIATLAATGPQWMQTGKELIDQLIAGLQTGDFSGVQNRINQIRGQVPIPTTTHPVPQSPGGGTGGGTSTGSPLWTISRGQYILDNGRTYMWSRELANLLGLGSTVEWDDKNYMVKIGSMWFSPWKVEDGRSYVGIRQVAEALGYRVAWDEQNEAVKIYKQYALGGPVGETGPAYLHKGEYVLPANLVDAIRLGMAPPARLEGGASGRVTVIINAPLLAPEKMVLSDEVDIKQVGMGLRREIMALATSRGR